MEESDPSGEKERWICISGGMEMEESEWDDMFGRQFNCGMDQEEDTDDAPMERASSLTSSLSLFPFKISLQRHCCDEAAAFALLAAMG